LASRTRKPLTHYAATFINSFIRYPYSPFLVHLIVTRRCNLECGYCTEYDKISPPVPKERILQSLRKLEELHAYAVAMTGGEPTLHPHLPEIIRFASDSIPHVSLITNGFFLTRELIESLNEAGLDRLQISLDGVKPTQTTQKVLRNTAERIELLAAHATFDVHINAVLGSCPLEETLEVLDFVSDLGLEATVQWMHDENGHFLNPRQIGKMEISRMAKAARRPRMYSKSVIRAGLNDQKSWKCRAGSRYLYVDEFSIVRYCAQARNLWQCPVDEINPELLKQNFYTPKPCVLGCTLGCVRNVSSYDIHRKQ